MWLRCFEIFRKSNVLTFNPDFNIMIDDEIRPQTICVGKNNAVTEGGAPCAAVPVPPKPDSVGDGDAPCVAVPVPPKSDSVGDGAQQVTAPEVLSATSDSPEQVQEVIETEIEDIDLTDASGNPGAEPVAPVATPSARGLKVWGCALCSLAIAFMVTLGGLLWFMSGDIMVKLAERGMTDATKMILLIPGADPNHRAQDGRTPLIMAMEQGNRDMVMVLLADSRTDVNLSDGQGRTPLFVAAERGDAELTRQLLAVPGVNRYNVDSRGLTPLNVAERNGHTAVAAQLMPDRTMARQELLQLNIDESQYQQALCQAAGQGEIALVRLLIQAGANVNTGGNEGKTPLFRAVEKNRTACVKLLLSTPGIDPNRGNTNNGVTPLWVASLSGYAEVVRLLIAAPGIDVNRADCDGETPLYWAAFNGRTECVRLLLSVPSIQVNLGDSKGVTPLRRAVLGGHADCAALIRAAGGR